MSIVIGVDVGGTNTDAVAIDLALSSTRPRDSVLAYTKTPTTRDTGIGIEEAVKTLLSELPESARNEIFTVNIGTTHFINAIVEKDAKKLAKVAVLRLCGPYAREVPPFTGLPSDLRPLVEGYSASLPGGLEIDGRIITHVDEGAVKQAAEEIRAAGITNVAVIGVYAPIDSVYRQEEAVRDTLRTVLGPRANITISRDVAGVGFIERENATILNATILPLAQQTIRQFKRSLSTLGISASLHLTKNDGTLITADEAARLPISTFLSGPTNSVTGAVFLADGETLGSHGALVLDIGGTTSDACWVEPSGLPRPAAAFSYLAGIRTSFSVPDLRSIGVGGGSIVRLGGGSSGSAVTVGPDSVGKDLAVKARAFGGSFLTATDITVAAGQEKDIGDRSLLADIGAADIAAVQARIQTQLEQVVDEMKTSDQDVLLILVGGGSIVCPPTLRGVSDIKRPPYSQVANAVGAAMAKVSTCVDTIVVLPDAQSEEDEVGRLRAQVVAQALERGAEDPKIVEETILPVPYVATRSRRIVVRAVGKLSVTQLQVAGTPTSAVDEPTDEAEIDAGADADDADAEADTAKTTTTVTTAPPPQVEDAPKVDLRTYRPSVQGGRWIISRTDLALIAEGCAILGCGGGGDTYASFLSVDSDLARGARVEVVAPAALPDDGFIPGVAVMGSPSTFSERLPSGQELQNAVQAVLAVKGAGLDSLTAVMSLEIGGSNGMRGFQAAIWTGRPLVDADLMGRAYPTLWQVTPNNAGILLVPAAAADGKGNTVVQTGASSNRDLEDLLRAVCVRMGQAASISIGGLSGAQVRHHAAQQSISLAWRIGRAVQLARAEKQDLVDSILSAYPGRRIVSGKITRVVRDVSGAFTIGSADIVPFSGPSSSPEPAVRVVFQNENISLFRTDTGTNNGPGQQQTATAETVLASVPDLICLLDAEDGRALGTQDYRYGLRVHVIALVGSPQWTQGPGLKNGGPEAFGLDIDYVPAAVFKEPRSVIEEYGGAASGVSL